MEITKKLEIFYTSAIEVANKESNDIINEYKESLRKQFEEFADQKKQEIQILYQTEESCIKREINRSISEAAIEQKRKLNERQQEKKQVLFERVKQLLREYIKTEEYDAYLVSKINMAKDFAIKSCGKSGFSWEKDVTIYLNVADADKKEKLEAETGCHLTISEIDFDGGIRAVVRTKNVLIDESFVTRINQEQEAYIF